MRIMLAMQLYCLKQFQAQSLAETVKGMKSGIPELQYDKVEPAHPTESKRPTLYCHCRMPWIYGTTASSLRALSMVKCSVCKQWFHVDCEAVATEYINTKLEW